ncbi:hypothetical protein sync_1083 [Synechococcus sp. CC9311]|nr:hypothetical protein sync_1083 [Synechococcus sp. CC9311]
MAGKTATEIHKPEALRERRRNLGHSLDGVQCLGFTAGR